MKVTKVEDISKASEVPSGLICPFMSGQALPVQATGSIATPNSPGIMTMMVPCALEKCGCYNTDFRACCFNYIPKISEIAGDVMRLADAFEKPMNGKTPLSAIADSLEELVEARKENK